MITATYKGKYYDVEYSIVNVSELEGELRIDAEYHNPKYIKILSKIHSKNNDLFWKFIIKFEAGKNLSQCKTGIPYIRTQNVRQIMIEKEGLSYVKTDKNKLKLLKKGDILFVRVGVGVGDCSVVNEEFENTTFSDNVIRIRLKEVNPFFITIFLNTKIGREYFSHVFKGTARPLISKENFQNLKIPLPSDTFQKFIEKLVLKAYEERQKAEQLYKRAEEILLEELGLKNWKPKTKKIKIGGKEFEEEENISIRMLSEVIKADRMDAEYWEPKYDEFLNKVKKKAILKPLKKFLSSKLLKGIEVGSGNYQEKGVSFIRVSNITKFGIIERDQKYISEEFYSDLKDKFEPKKGEILLTKDATPGIAYVLKEDIKGIIASGIVKLKVKNIEKEYLTLVINSIVGQMQILKEGGGSIISHWKPSQIENLLISLLDSETQQKISQLIQQSFEARKNSKKLLEIAKRTVEIYIEKDEKEGLNYARNKLNELDIEIN